MIDQQSTVHFMRIGSDHAWNGILSLPSRSCTSVYLCLLRTEEYTAVDKPIFLTLLRFYLTYTLRNC